jgi:hypothetical protein
MKQQHPTWEKLASTSVVYLTWLGAKRIVLFTAALTMIVALSSCNEQDVPFNTNYEDTIRQGNPAPTGVSPGYTDHTGTR